MGGAGSKLLIKTPWEGRPLWSSSEESASKYSGRGLIPGQGIKIHMVRSD